MSITQYRMKKKISLLISLSILILLVGCTKITSTEGEYITYVNPIIEQNNKYINTISKGYKYYLPKGVVVSKDKDYNIEFVANNTTLYMYTDIISYYYKRELNLSNKDNFTYYKKINKGKKTGYIGVNKEDEDSYYIKIVYNYACVEFYANEENYPKLITLSTIILNSVNYNNKMIENILDNSKLSSSDMIYQIEELKKSESSFSQYLNEYVKEDEKEELPDND